MKIIFFIAHPKHVHIFKNSIWSLQKKGHICKLLVVEKDVILVLLNKYNLNYEKVGKNLSGLTKKGFESIIRFVNIFFKIKKIMPDIIIGQADPFFVICGKLLGIKNIVLPDTETAFLSNKIAIPLAQNILISRSYKNNLDKAIRISSYLELAYLHPSVFLPNEKIKSYLGIKEDTNYVIFRFISWKAHHDIGHSGISDENKIKAVKAFSKFGKVFISSENPLPKALKQYELHIPPDKMHDVLANATIFYGESATMAAESAVLGTPAIYIDNKGRGYTDELERKFGLLFNFSESREDQEMSIQKGVELLSLNNIKNIWQGKREIMLKMLINYTDFLIWFIENYPTSREIIIEDPDYQNRFKV